MTNMLRQNWIFAWIALATGLMLCVPLLAMHFTDAVDWDGADFLAMGVLLFGSASGFVLLARRVPRTYRWLLAGAALLAFLYAWAELAVGIFTHLGS